MKRKKVKRKKLPSMRKLHKKAWDLQSIWVRSHDADFNGYNRCYTCYKVYHWKELQAGHFIHGSYDFSVEDNIRPQCSSCNKWGHGKTMEYYVHLMQEIGKEKADHARTRPHWNGYSREELNKVIHAYELRSHHKVPPEGAR